MRYPAKRSGRRSKPVSYFKHGTCNTVDDRSGFVEKMDEAEKEWSGLYVSHDQIEQRQPQDFPVTPRPPRVYAEARTQDEEAINVYTPPEDVTKL